MVASRGLACPLADQSLQDCGGVDVTGVRSCEVSVDSTGTHPPPPFTLSVFPDYHLIKVVFRGTFWFTEFASFLELVSSLDPRYSDFTCAN